MADAGAEGGRSGAPRRPRRGAHGRAERGVHARRVPLSAAVSPRISSAWETSSRAARPDSTLLTTIVAIDPIQFVFDVSESDYLNTCGKRERRGPASRDAANPVRIRLLDETDFTRTGRMDFVDNRLDSTTGTMRGRALVPNPGAFLAPGQFGRLQAGVRWTMRSSCPTAPSSLTSRDDSLWTVDEKNMPEQRFVEPGGLERGLRIVRAGLQSGDRIVMTACSACARARRWTRKTVASSLLRASRGTGSAFSKLFIDRPILAAVISGADHVGGRGGVPRAPGVAIPEVAPPTITVSASTPGASLDLGRRPSRPLSSRKSTVWRTCSICPLNPRPTVASRSLSPSRRYRPGRGAGARAEPREHRPASTAGRRAPARCRHARRVAGHPAGGAHHSPTPRAMNQLYLSNYTLLTIRDRLARLDGVATSGCSARASTRCAIWLDPHRVASLGMTAGEVIQRFQPERAGGRRRPRSSPSTRQGAFEVSVQLLGPSHGSRAVRRRPAQERRGRTAGTRPRYRSDRARRRRLLDERVSRRQTGGRDAGVPASRLNALETAHGVQAAMAALRPRFRRGSTTTSSTTRRSSSGNP